MALGLFILLLFALLVLLLAAAVLIEDTPLKMLFVLFPIDRFTLVVPLIAALLLSFQLLPSV